METVLLLLLSGAVALIPGMLVWGTALAIYAAYRRLATRLTAETG